MFVRQASRNARGTQLTRRGLGGCRTPGKNALDLHQGAAVSPNGLVIPFDPHSRAPGTGSGV